MTWQKSRTPEGNDKFNCIDGNLEGVSILISERDDNRRYCEIRLPEPKTMAEARVLGPLEDKISDLCSEVKRFQTSPGLTASRYCFTFQQSDGDAQKFSYAIAGIDEVEEIDEEIKEDMMQHANSGASIKSAMKT